LVRERWGRGPSRSRAYWAGRDTLLVMLDDAHTEAELTLITAGYESQVLDGRRLLASIAATDLRRIAASATDRAVLGVLSQSSIDPPKTVHVFVFAPVDAAPGQAPGMDHEALGENLRQALENTEAARALMAEGVQARRRSAQNRANARAVRERHVKRGGGT
jgi:uncharacterized protein YbcI